MKAAPPAAAATGLRGLLGRMFQSVGAKRDFSARRAKAAHGWKGRERERGVDVQDIIEEAVVNFSIIFNIVAPMWAWTRAGTFRLFEGYCILLQNSIAYSALDGTSCGSQVVVVCYVCKLLRCDKKCEQI